MSSHNVHFALTRDQFLKDLYSFMEVKGQAITKTPSLGYQDLDLFLLYRLVIERGGMDEVTRKQEWKTVYQDLGIPTMSTSASYNTRTNYKKYLYLYELEHCNFDDMPRPLGLEPKFAIGQFIRIVSEVYDGQVFYALIVKCRFRNGRNAYYVHYNGWSSSHDEWMPEDVLSPLIDDEKRNPESLTNPPPSRSSKSNRIIEDPLLLPGERPLPSVSGPGSRQSSGAATPKRSRRADEGWTSDELENDSEEKESREARRAGSFILRGTRSMSAVSLISPLDVAKLTPDWDLIKHELFNSEQRGYGSLIVRRNRVHHNADNSVPIYSIDSAELNYLEENSFDLDPGVKFLEVRVKEIRDGSVQKSSVHPGYKDDGRSLQEIQESVDSLESQLALLERKYNKNARLLAKMPKLTRVEVNRKSRIDPSVPAGPAIDTAATTRQRRRRL